MLFGIIAHTTPKIGIVVGTDISSTIAVACQRFSQGKRHRTAWVVGAEAIAVAPSSASRPIWPQALPGRGQQNAGLNHEIRFDPGELRDALLAEA